MRFRLPRPRLTADREPGGGLFPTSEYKFHGFIQQ